MIDNKRAILRLNKKAHEELMEYRKPKEPQKPAPHPVIHPAPPPEAA